MAFQMPEPRVVHRPKVTRFILPKPAGMEISERTPGMRRPMNTLGLPYLLKKFIAASTSEARTSHIQSAILRSRSRPSHTPTP